MKKTHQLSILVCAIVLNLIACKKIDFPHAPVAKDCDYQSARSNYLYLVEFIFVDSPLFVKHYATASHKIDYISAKYQGAIGTLDDAVPDLSLHYNGLRTYCITASKDTLISLYRNPQGTLIGARAPQDMGVSELFQHQSDFKFNYLSGKISNIEIKEITEKQWHPFIKVFYNADLSNVLKIAYYLDDKLFATAGFTYDLSKTAKHQYYADQHVSFPFHFFTFLKYINVFPELQPKNLLKKYAVLYTEKGNDANEETYYSKQTFDGVGNLTSYSLGGAVDFPPQPDEYWHIKWNCCQLFGGDSY